MQLPLFLNTERKLRNISWVTIFLSLIVPPTLPAGLLSERYKFAFTMFNQSIKIVISAIIRQLRLGLIDLHNSLKSKR